MDSRLTNYQEQTGRVDILSRFQLQCTLPRNPLFRNSRYRFPSVLSLFSDRLRAWKITTYVLSYSSLFVIPILLFCKMARFITMYKKYELGEVFISGIIFMITFYYLTKIYKMMQLIAIEKEIV